MANKGHRISSLSMQERQELFTSLCARPHASQHTACRGGAARLLHSTHHHAKVGRLHNDTYASRLQDL